MSCPEREVDDPVVSPLLADLLSLPPTWLAVGGAEVLLDDTLLLARALGRADKTVRLRVLSGRSHMFWQWPDLFNDAREALEDAAAFLLGNSERKVAAAPSIP